MSGGASHGVSAAECVSCAVLLDMLAHKVLAEMRLSYRWRRAAGDAWLPDPDTLTLDDTWCARAAAVLRAEACRLRRKACDDVADHGA